jgi:hypothetical protein
MIIILSIISAAFYRLGGMFQTKIRDLGCPTIATVALWLLGIHNPIVLVLHFFLVFGALTTYWDFLFGEDNFFMHGATIGIAGFALSISNIPFRALCLRTVILAVTMGSLNLIVNKIPWLPFKDWIEELSRGFLIIITLLLI